MERRSVQDSILRFLAPESTTSDVSTAWHGNHPGRNRLTLIESSRCPAALTMLSFASLVKRTSQARPINMGIILSTSAESCGPDVSDQNSDRYIFAWLLVYVVSRASLPCCTRWQPYRSRAWSWETGEVIRQELLQAWVRLSSGTHGFVTLCFRGCFVESRSGLFEEGGEVGELHYCLGLEVWREPGKTLITQSKHTRGILKRFNMIECKATSTRTEFQIV